MESSYHYSSNYVILQPFHSTNYVIKGCALTRVISHAHYSCVLLSISPCRLVCDQIPYLCILVAINYKTLPTTREHDSLFMNVFQKIVYCMMVAMVKHGAGFLISRTFLSISSVISWMSRETH